LDLIQAHDIPNVIVSSPPHSTQLIGLRLKRQLGSRIRLILDYRDSWNGTVLFRKRLSLLQALNSELERKVLSYADHLLYVSSPILAKLQKRYRRLPPHSTLVSNGYDERMLAHIRSTAEFSVSLDGPLKIGHFGPFSEARRSFRDPRMLVDAIRKHSLPVKIAAYGTYQSESTDYQEGGVIDLRTPLPHAEALRAMACCDVLLVLHSERRGSDEVLSGKLFDYIAARRPILVVGPSEMAAADFVKCNALGYFADLWDETDLVQTLTLLINRKRRGLLESTPSDAIKPFSRQEQYRKLLPLLHDTVSPGARPA
jgi:glycosyltransferase involved in cell wall biosynthesis